MSQSSQKNPYHHGDLRRALVESGLAVLKGEGLEKLTLRRAAREAGVSAAAPYRHFKDKKTLLAAIAENGFRELHAMLEDSNASAPGDLDRSGQTYLRFALKEPEVYRLMFTQNVLSDSAGAESLDEASSSAFGSLVATIEVGMAANLIQETDTTQLALAAWALVHGIAMLLIDGVLNDGPYGEIPPEDVLKSCQTLFRTGWQAL